MSGECGTCSFTCEFRGANAHHLCLYFRVYLCKQWQELKVFNDHTALATGVRFGQNATFVASTSMDRSLKVFGAPGTDI